MSLATRCILLVILLSSLGVLAGRSGFEERTPARAVADYLLPRFLTQGYIYVDEVQYPDKESALVILSDTQGNEVEVSMFIQEDDNGFTVVQHLENRG